MKSVIIDLFTSVETSLTADIEDSLNGDRRELRKLLSRLRYDIGAANVGSVRSVVYSIRPMIYSVRLWSIVSDQWSIMSWQWFIHSYQSFRFPHIFTHFAECACNTGENRSYDFCANWSATQLLPIYSTSRRPVCIQFAEKVSSYCFSLSTDCFIECSFELYAFFELVKGIRKFNLGCCKWHFFFNLWGLCPAF